MRISSDIQVNLSHFHSVLDVETNFDIVYHTIVIGGRQACLYFIDGFTKDEVLKPEDIPDTAHDFSKKYVTYGEVGLSDEEQQILTQLFSGLSCLFIDGYDKCILIDCRTYPARSVSEPDKDKVLRGSRDGFVETLIFNTALIRRRIRDKNLTVEIAQAGVADIHPAGFRGKVTVHDVVEPEELRQPGRSVGVGRPGDLHDVAGGACHAGVERVDAVLVHVAYDEEVDGDVGLDDGVEALLPVEQGSVFGEDDGGSVRAPGSALHVEGVLFNALPVDVAVHG